MSAAVNTIAQPSAPAQAPATTPAPAAPAKPGAVSEQSLIQAAIAAGDAAVAAEPAPVPEAAPVPTATTTEPKADAAPPAPTPEPEAPKGPASKGWAAVMEREKAIRKREQEFELRAQELQHKAQQWEAQRQQLEAQAKQQQGQLGDVRQALVRDPFGTLKALGVPFEQIAQLAIDKKASFDPTFQPQQPEQENPVLAEVRALKQEIAQREAAQQQQAFINQYQGSVAATLAKPEFELARAMPDAVHQAMVVASRYAQKYGQVLPPEKALASIQETYREHLQTLSSHQAIRKILGPPAPAPAPAAPVSAAPQAQPQTLTNQLHTAPPGNGSSEDRESLLARLAKEMPDISWS